jgi:2-oxoglutarate dehydrogenase E2 component (dihydrolipoamide succinyltransferase)
VSQAKQPVISVSMPQLNVNDEGGTLVNWCVENGGEAVEGETLCEVETSKAVGEVPAPTNGVLYKLKEVGQEVTVGEVFAYIGPSFREIERYINTEKTVGKEETRLCSNASREATAGAMELARRYNIDLADISASGKIRLADVEAYVDREHLHTASVDNHPGSADKSKLTASEQPLSEALTKLVTEQQPLSEHQYSIARHLARTQGQTVTAYLAMDVDMTVAKGWIESRRKQGLMTGLLPVCLYGVAAAVREESKLISFRQDRRVYQYNSLDIAYTARSGDGRLFTPVVRQVNKRSLEELVGEVGRLNMAVFRGNLDSQEMLGGGLTVSVLDDTPVRFHVGLQNQFQSTMIAAGAIRKEVQMFDGQPVVCPIITFTLAYDHGLMDGWEAAHALAAMKSAIESIDV